MLIGPKQRLKSNNSTIKTVIVVIAYTILKAPFQYLALSYMRKEESLLLAFPKVGMPCHSTLHRGKLIVWGRKFVLVLVDKGKVFLRFLVCFFLLFIILVLNCPPCWLAMLVDIIQDRVNCRLLLLPNSYSQTVFFYLFVVQ